MNNKDCINTVLISIWSAIGIERPSNHEGILEFVLKDVTQRKGMDDKFTPISFEAQKSDVQESFKRYLEREPYQIQYEDRLGGVLH